MPTSLTVHYGDVVSKDQFNDGNDPTYDPYVFQGWKKDGTSDYDFSSKITKSVTVNASWGAPAATVNGKGYLTLDEAVDAAYSGSRLSLRDKTAQAARLPALLEPTVMFAELSTPIPTQTIMST